MPNFQSTQIAAEAADVTTDWARAGLNDRRGLHIANFSFTGDVAENDTLELCRLPIGARIIEGFLDHTAFGATVTLDIGDGTTVDLYANGLDIAAAATKVFANTDALKGAGGTQVAASTVLTATFLVANPDSGTLEGWVSYVIGDN